MLQYACSAMGFYSLIAASHITTAAIAIWVGYKLSHPTKPKGAKYSDEVLNFEGTKPRRNR